MAPGWQARGIDRQRVETESAAQKALAIGGIHCPPTPRHSNSAEILRLSFARGCSLRKMKVCITIKKEDAPRGERK